MVLPTWRQLTTPPNLMSLVRLPLGALVWVAPANVAWVLALMALAAVSDLLDGRMARASGVPNDELGAWLDPLCDKVFVVSTLVAVWMAHGPAWWLGVLAATREFILLGLVAVRFAVPSLRERHVPFKAKLLGKATTVAQFFLFGAVLLQLESAWFPLSVLAAVLGLGAGVQYAVRAARLLKLPPE
jgi:cardiolipin synthase